MSINDFRISKLYFWMEIFLTGFFAGLSLMYWLFISRFLSKKKNLKGSTVIITNARSNLMLELAHQLQQIHHCRVALVHNTATSIENSWNLNCFNGKNSVLPITYDCNLLDNNDVKRLVEKVRSDYGKIDMVIENTLNSEEGHNVDQLANFLQQTSNNILIFLQLLVNFVPTFLKQEGGTLISLKNGISASEAFLATKPEIENVVRAITNDESQMKFINLSTVLCYPQPDGWLAKKLEKNLQMDDKFIVERIVHGILSKKSLVRVHFHHNIVEYCYRRGAAVLRRIVSKVNNEGITVPVRL